MIIRMIIGIAYMLSSSFNELYKYLKRHHTVQSLIRPASLDKTTSAYVGNRIINSRTYPSFI